MRRIACFVSTSCIAAALALTTASCGDDTLPGGGGACSVDFASAGADSSFGEPRIDALLEATAEFNANATGLEMDLLTACNNISTDLGGETGADVGAACDNAVAAIDAVYAANAAVVASVEYTPAVCTVSATAVTDCVAECDASFDASMTPVMCTGGMLSGSCSAMCSGSCTVEGNVACEGSCSGTCNGSCSGTVQATCTGTCMGTCDGTCSAMDAMGNCNGTCDGVCRGSCDGTIEGDCSAECSGMCEGSCRAMVAGMCEGRCTGDCDVEFTEPQCEGGEVQVMADADCSASCETEASVNAECTEPSVVVTFTGVATASEDLSTLATTLRENLPIVLRAGQKATIMASAGVEMNTRIQAAGEAFTDASLGAQACLVEAATVFTDAVASVGASATVSVEVSASASGTAG